MPAVEAPVTPDQPIITPLDRILQKHGVPRSLPPELLSYARERGLVLDGEDEPEPGADDLADVTPEPEVGGDQPGSETPESFMDFDPTTIPDDADADWLANRYGEMNKHFTQRMQEVGEGRREAEQSQALIEGLRNPQTMPHYLRLLGIDLTDPQTLDVLGFELGDDDEPVPLDDELDPNERINQLETKAEQEKQERQVAEYEQALDNLADTELEALEGAWGRKLDEDEDKFLRFQAESNPGPDGLPDYESAAKLLKGWVGRREQEFAKRRSEPGRGPLGGKPGGKALDPTKDEDRVAIGTAAAEAAMASQK